jgi:hypothetical protein
LVVNEGLPGASGTRVTSESTVRFETKFSHQITSSLRKWGEDFPGVVAYSREASSLEKGLEEELGIELEYSGETSIEFSDGMQAYSERRGIKRCSTQTRVYMISAGNRVGSQKSNNFIGGESSRVFEALQNLCDRILRLWYQPIGSRLFSVGTTRHELELGGTRALAQAYRCRELDEVASSHVMVIKEWSKESYSVNDTEIRVEVGLDIREEDRRAISSCTTMCFVSGCTPKKDGVTYPNFPRANMLGEKLIASWNTRRSDS